ncbi:RNA polymerase sigma factor RpoH [Rickettsia endosymbiont of Cardiosporidium cionae]|uniref:RNA polymerase sigma factor RpoH n=1 Tax=Rickettsia endosymbiont of Cardiosporidium cionae TaxID=2777155 RepID=UPI001894F395|nr:RNA polymerase sigma factor RpoH [Rickettsia endosymbiont of Cardiosporidium cionae]KAF8818637.1 RNA polymerase sigma factor RpoH [Rickettsia endosymbiont of Cardiosporidium cionae]
MYELTAINSKYCIYEYLQQVNNIPSLSCEEEVDLAKQYYASKTIEAAHKLVTSHLKLVVKIALGYRNYKLPMFDLIAEGNIGLMQAVKKYNPHLGHRLSTYAMWWIKAAIQEFILKSWSLVKIGTTNAQKKIFFSLNKIKQKISNMYARPVNSEDSKDIAISLGVNESELLEMEQRLSGHDVSLNQSLNDNNNSPEMLELIPETRLGQEKKYMLIQNTKLQQALLNKAIDSLQKRDKEIFIARKLKESPSTLLELSIKYSISKERVRQIENRAFAKVKQFMLTGLV